MIGAVDHADLLAIARRVRAAVGLDDTETLHTELTRLRAAVMEHVHLERPRLERLPGAGVTVALDGQRRLLHQLTTVLFGDGDDDCTCVVRAAEIDVALRRQVQLEHALFRRHESAAACCTDSPPRTADDYI